MTKLLAYFSSSAASLCFICLGWGIGLMCRFPLDWNPPSAVQNLLGGLIGSVGSIAAAFLILKKQLADRDEQKGNELMALRQAVARALQVDVDNARRSFEELGERLAGFTPVDEYVQGVRGFHKFAVGMPAFTRLSNVLTQLGEPLSSALIYVDAEVIRVNQHIHSKIPGTLSSDEFKAALKRLLIDMNTARNLLGDYVAQSFVATAGSGASG